MYALDAETNDLILVHVDLVRENLVDVACIYRAARDISPHIVDKEALPQSVRGATEKHDKLPIVALIGQEAEGNEVLRPGIGLDLYRRPACHGVEV